jgi:integrase
MKKPTVTVLHDTRRKKDNNLYPVKIRISKTRNDNRSFSIGLDLSPEDFIKACEQNPKYRFQALKKKINFAVSKAESIIEGLMPFFNYESFKNKFQQKLDKPQEFEKSTLLFVYNELVHEMRLREQLGNISIYKSAVNSILDFASQKNIYLEEITPIFLQKYEKWMKSLGNEINTIGIKTRTIRAIFNYARKKKRYIPMDCYPFDNYIPPYERKPKEFLKPHEIEQLMNYKPSSSERDLARNYWLICYFCNGAYLSDIANFKFKHIQSNFIIFYREKTKNTLRQFRPYIKIYVTHELRTLIAKIGNKDMSPDNYIFDLKNDRLSHEENWNKLRSLNSNMSKLIGKIMKELGINKKISMRKSRHSLANTLKNHGASTEFIQETLGHADKATAENYLHDFDDDIRIRVFTEAVSQQQSKAI